MAQGAPLLVVILGCMLPLKMQVTRRIPRPSLRVFAPQCKNDPLSALPDPSVIGELELNLNRPFLYEIRTRQGIPLFIGLCTQPDEAA